MLVFHVDIIPGLAVEIEIDMDIYTDSDVDIDNWQ